MGLTISVRNGDAACVEAAQVTAAWSRGLWVLLLGRGVLLRLLGRVCVCVLSGAAWGNHGRLRLVGRLLRVDLLLLRGVRRGRREYRTPSLMAFIGLAAAAGAAGNVCS